MHFLLLLHVKLLLCKFNFLWIRERAQKINNLMIKSNLYSLLEIFFLNSFKSWIFPVACVSWLIIASPLITSSSCSACSNRRLRALLQHLLVCAGLKTNLTHYFTLSVLVGAQSLLRQPSHLWSVIIAQASRPVVGQLCSQAEPNCQAFLRYHFLSEILKPCGLSSLPHCST